MNGNRMRRCRANHRRDRLARRGTAAAEFALCLPLLVALLMGAMETCNLLYLRTRMNSVAYEAARLATRPKTAGTTAATTASVSAYCTSLLSQLGVQGVQSNNIQVLDPTTGNAKDPSTAVPQDLIEVQITAPLSQNCFTNLVLSGSQNLTAQATLIME